MELIDLAKQFGLPMAMLIVAVYWLNRNNNAAYARLDAERTQRLDEHSTRIEQLRKDVEECNADRRDLWKQISPK
jgi:hypothetical protein